MSSNEILCNGNSALSGSDYSLKKDSQKCLQPKQALNLNWLIYMSYARGDFQYCKDIINHQFESSYDFEYLYFMQARFYIKKTCFQTEHKLKQVLKKWKLK